MNDFKEIFLWEKTKELTALFNDMES